MSESGIECESGNTDKGVVKCRAGRLLADQAGHVLHSPWKTRNNRMEKNKVGLYHGWTTDTG